MTTRVLAGFAEILDGYDAVVLDQWGVLHDGVGVCPGVCEFLAHLRDRGTPVAILTNSSKSSARNSDRLETVFDIDRSMYGAMVSTAQLLRDRLADRIHGSIVENKVVEHVFVVAHEGDECLLDDVDVSRTSVDKADAVVLLSVDPRMPLRDHAEWIEAASSHGLRLLTPSADVHTVRPGAVLDGMNGVIRAYLQTGGHVLNFGKPEPGPYVECVRLLGLDQAAPRVLAVGDQIGSDVFGARQHGWDAALVLTGAGRASWALHQEDPVGGPAYVPNYLADSLRLTPPRTLT